MSFQPAANRTDPPYPRILAPKSPGWMPARRFAWTGTSAFWPRRAARLNIHARPHGPASVGTRSSLSVLRQAFDWKGELVSVSATQLSARLRSSALAAGVSGLIVGLGALIGGTFLWLFAALGVIVSLLGHLFSDPVVLHVTRARELRERDAAEVHRSVRELALRAGIPTPRLYVMPGDRAKAFATGCNPQHAAIAITEGLLLDLPLEQTRGVLAHELAHIANRDILVSPPRFPA